MIYEAHRCLNINEIYKNYRFKHWIVLHPILRSIFLHSIENVFKITVWNSNHVNFVNDNTIEVNFDDLLLEVLHLSLVREFNFININSVNFWIHSLCIKLINIHNSNRKIRFRKYVNLQYIFDGYSFVWLIYKNVQFQLCDDSRHQFIWYCIIKIVNDIQDHVELDKINIFENCSRSIRNICFKNVKHRRFFYRMNMIKKRIQLTWKLSEEIVVDRTYNVFNSVFHTMFQKINFFNYSFQLDLSSFKKQLVTHDNYRDFFKSLYIINIEKNSVRRDH